MKKSLFIVFAFISIIANAQKSNLVLTSNGPVQLMAHLQDDGSFVYSVYYKGKPVVGNSSLGVVLAKPELTLTKFMLNGVDSSFVNQSWETVWGEQNTIRNKYKEFIFHLSDQQTNSYFVNIIFRLFEDGLGFRYEFPKQKKSPIFYFKR